MDTDCSVISGISCFNYQYLIFYMVKQEQMTMKKSIRTLETLEDRRMLYAYTGASWNDSDVSFSYAPDGTDAEGDDSELFSILDAVADTEVWQKEFARALQTWSNESNLNFHEVADDGSEHDLTNVQQGDPRFGDIRLSSQELGGFLAYAYYPSSFWAIGGDIFLDHGRNFNIGSTYDIYSVLLHEIGHAIGFDHTPGTVMNSSYQGVVTGLTQDDIDGVQFVYGARSEDIFDATSNNDTLSTASVVLTNIEGHVDFDADLTSLSDVDFYEITAPLHGDGNLDISVNVDHISLLAPSLSLYDDTQTLISTIDVGTDYGINLLGQYTNITAGHTYYIGIDGSLSDSFGMGAYKLDIAFGVNTADGNFDGTVDGLDYLIWAANFDSNPGSDGDISDGDYNDDGTVDGLDYIIWANEFNGGGIRAAENLETWEDTVDDFFSTNYDWYQEERTEFSLKEDYLLDLSS